MDANDPKRISRQMFALITAGFYHQVKEMVDRYGLSFVPEWGDGYSLVYHALSHRNVGIARLLLRKGAVVNVRFDVSSPLVLAVQLKDVETIRMLLDKGANVNIDVKKDEQKEPLFHHVLQSFERLDWDVDLVKTFLKHGADLDALDSFGQTALFHAVNQCSKPLVKLFLAWGAKANVTNCSDLTPLHVAVQKCPGEVVEMLVDAGAEIDCRARDGATPLQLACDKGMGTATKLIVQFLLSKGADVTLTNEDGITALHAAAGRNFQVAELLLSVGADINVKSKDGRTPLHCASAFGNVRSVELLLKKDANIHAETLAKRTPLHFAVLHKQTTIAERLLKKGADVNAQPEDGKTCLLMAVASSMPDMVDLLLSYKPDRSANQNCVPVAVRISEASYNRSHREAYQTFIVEKLLEYGFSLKAQDVKKPGLVFIPAVRNGFVKTAEAILESTDRAGELLSSTFDGLMPLHVAVRAKRLEMARLLLRFGADVNAKTVGGKRPLDYAIANADWKMFQLLVSQQADVKYDPRLLLSAAGTRVKIVDFLLQQGAYVNVRNRLRHTPLHCSVRRFYDLQGFKVIEIDPIVEAVKITMLLLRRGAKVNARDRNGETPLMWAVERGSPELVTVLLDHHANVNIRSKIKSGTALDQAVASQQYRLCELLLKRGARMNFKTERSVRPLQYAADKGNFDLLKLLVEYGVDVNIASETAPSHFKQRFAMHAAVKCGHLRIVQYLLECTEVSVNSTTTHHPSFEAIEIAYESKNTRREVYLFLVKHIVKAKAANLYVNETNSNFGHPWNIRHDIDTLTLKVGSQKMSIVQFSDLCKAEISAMHNHKIENTLLSFNSILTASTNQLVNLSRNADLKNALSSDSFFSEFPIYASWIRGRFSIGERRRLWYDQGTEAMRTMFPTLPCDCIHYVLDYLATEDIRMLILASQADDKNAIHSRRDRYLWYLKTRSSWTRSLWPKSAHRIPTIRKREQPKKSSKKRKLSRK